MPMQSLKSRFFYYVIKRKLAQMRALNLSLTDSRALQEMNAPTMFKIPKGILIDNIKIKGLQGLWLRPQSQKHQGLLMYLHGGAYIQGSINTSRALAANLALAANTATFSIDYRLAPEHPYPAALEDAFEAYCELLEQNPGVPIALTGDSAGGGLCLALALKIRDSGMIPPAALALLSPWTDLTLSNITHKTLAKVDPFFQTTEPLSKAALAYANGQDKKLPYISPQFANFEKFPPTLIHVGALEALLDDSLILAQRMSEAGVEVEVKVYKGMWHVWQVFAGLFKEANESVAELGSFVRNKLQVSATESIE